MNAVDDTEELDKAIDETLELMDVNVDTVDKGTRDFLRKIELALRAEMELRTELESGLREHNLSVSSISRVSEVSRQTFYNRPILSRYVNARHAKALGRSEAAKNEALRRRIASLEKRLEDMESQAVDMVQLYMENNELKRRLRNAEVKGQGGLAAVDGLGEVLPLRR